MKVDLDGLAANIKSCIDPKKDRGGWAYMVDEMADHIKKLERIAEIAAVWREKIDKTLHEFLKQNGWVQNDSGYWSHPRDGVFVDYFADGAIGVEMDRALNDLERTGG